MEKELNVDSLNISDQARDSLQGDSDSDSDSDTFKDSPVVYYCKECKKLVEPIKKRKKIACPECKNTQLSMGTERSIKNYYKITE